MGFMGSQHLFPQLAQEKLGQVDLYSSLMVPAIYSKRKLGQTDLMNISVEDLQFGWTQTVFLPRWAVFPDLISDTACLNEDDHGSHGPCLRGNQ